LPGIAGFFASSDEEWCVYTPKVVCEIRTDLMVNNKENVVYNQDSLDVVVEIVREKGIVTAQEVIDRTKYSKSTVYRVLRNIAAHGYIEYVDKGTFRITSLGSRDFPKFRARDGNDIYFANLSVYEHFDVDTSLSGMALKKLGPTLQAMLNLAEEFAYLDANAPQSQMRAITMKYRVHVKDLEDIADKVAKLSYVLNSMVNTPDAIALKGVVKYFDKQEHGDLPIPAVRYKPF
jgi:predicted HTH transcriptional regulator